ncbi:MAG: rRNA (adenine2503-C2)-methyltransferase, partial [Methylobacteriaceae bacterium]|nr:rRNA (adenine2503-C2)-methyltransferase [Methylobacteriaceae bacterium]
MTLAADTLAAPRMAAPPILPAAVPAKPSLAGATRAELAQALAAVGVPPREIRMRVTQLWHWIYHYGIRDFSAMLNVSKHLRAALAEAYTLARPEIVTEQLSSDGTRKWLIRMP